MTTPENSTYTSLEAALSATQKYAFENGFALTTNRSTRDMSSVDLNCDRGGQVFSAVGLHSEQER